MGYEIHLKYDPYIDNNADYINYNGNFMVKKL